MIRRERMDVQCAEAAPECQMLVRRDVLVAEENYEIIKQRLFKFRDRLVIYLR